MLVKCFYFGDVLNLDFPHIEKLKMFVLTSESAQKCVNYANLRKKYPITLLIGLFLLFQLRGKSRFYRLKKFDNINYRWLDYFLSLAF